MNTPTPGEQNIETTLGRLSKADLLTLIKRMVQLYPDLAGLIEMAEPTDSKPQRPPFNPEFYRRQIDEIFYTTDRNTWGSEGDNSPWLKPRGFSGDTSNRTIVPFMRISA